MEALFIADDHAAAEATWGIYQRVIAAYRESDDTRGKQLMQALIAGVSNVAALGRSVLGEDGWKDIGVSAALTEVITLGRTLKRRAPDVLAYFDRPCTSNGPTEAVNGRLEHLRGSALGFRNLANYPITQVVQQAVAQLQTALTLRQPQ